jgi:hypothetical protein
MGADVVEEVEIKKEVDFGKKYYVVRVSDRVSAKEVVFPMPGFGNSYSTEYGIDLSYSKAWARAYIYCFNNTWACRGHGMTEGWVESQGYVRKGEIKDFVERIREELKNAENGTPEILDIFREVKEKVKDILRLYD